MPRVTFPDVLQRHVPCPPQEVEGCTVREALDRAFGVNPRARLYVLDERGALRSHMVVFVGGKQVTDRTGLSDAVDGTSEIHVMQALSGG